jgi:hypothetical protein
VVAALPATAADAEPAGAGAAEGAGGSAGQREARLLKMIEQLKKRMEQYRAGGRGCTASLLQNCL